MIILLLLNIDILSFLTSFNINFLTSTFSHGTFTPYSIIIIIIIIIIIRRRRIILTIILINVGPWTEVQPTSKTHWTMTIIINLSDNV